MPYDFKRIEAEWQAYWTERRTFETRIDPSRPKLYVLDMFPYPSAEGLHVGHPKGYVATDTWARFKRMRGFNVLHPMGWDAFGLPAEQHAVRTGQHPRVTTRRSTANYKRQLQALGISYDWSREIDTTDPRYFKWTQWIFEVLYERGLAYQAEVPVNWCPALGTVLANEEVRDGKSERGGHPVERRPMRQWMLKITDYAERLLADLELVDWPESIVKMQRDWIGRSEGARISFALEKKSLGAIEVFTTRPDTLLGATYMVLAPEHPLVEKLTARGRRAEVEAYVRRAAALSERSRLADQREKSGVFSGSYALHPVTGAKLPIWIADYVLASYGTGAIMAVPAHDERDWEFARAFDLPIVEVVSGGDPSRAAFTGEGVCVNSRFLDGLDTPAASRRMIEWLEENGAGEGMVHYKLRDWLFSRQRYWGEPFPLLYLEDGTVKLVPLDELPVLLPDLEDYEPSGNFEPPLARATDWLHTTDSETGRPARREANTMPQWAGSCWYYLRFCDPTNDEAFCSPEAERYWMPVDLYVGGAEHAVLHLLYARFWHKVLYDAGFVSTPEPFMRLLNPGMIQGRSYRCWSDNVRGDPDALVRYFGPDEVEIRGQTAFERGSGRELREHPVVPADVRWIDGRPFHPDLDVRLEEVIERMAKSRGNVVNPDAVIEENGADSLRLYEMFLGPLAKAAPWSTEGIAGVSRFLVRAWRLVFDDDAPGGVRELPAGDGTPAQRRLLARAIDAVSRQLEALEFNTAISDLMVFARDVEKEAPIPRAAAEAFTLLLSPFAPHLGEELWRALGHEESLAYEPWPEADPAALVEDQVEIAVQVGGRLRARVRVPAGADERTALAAALAEENVRRHVGDRELRRVVYVPGKLVNLVP